MDSGNYVFVSNVIREHFSKNNDLQQLIDVVPAEPVSILPAKRVISQFEPNLNKFYIEKKRNKLKVKTVRDIRNEFEKDMLLELSSDLEKQQSLLLRKIRVGSSRDENTKTFAKNMLNTNKPISRTVWQMLTNLNPEGHIHSTQYLLWNAKNIKLTGSRGGKKKFIYKRDLSKLSFNKSNIKNILRSNFLKKNKTLLHNSLAVKFKPGPLTKKRILDESYQKHNIGDLELVNLPKLALEVQPMLNIPLEPSISKFICSFRDVDGMITAKWAEFAVSVLGTMNDSRAVQDSKESVIFEMNYKCNQSRLLMRRDNTNNDHNNDLENYTTSNIFFSTNTSIDTEVKIIINDLLDCVEISVNQDHMYKLDDESRINSLAMNSNKNKRKYGELERLDVTIINLSKGAPSNQELCSMPYCNLGCICDSLKYENNLKLHCGQIDCIFGCKCYFTNFSTISDVEKIGFSANANLSREERKFHQTLILTDEENILLKSKRRDWKASKKYASFYNKMCLKSERKNKRILMIPLLKLSYENIEPWCMIHNLYRCFCKGKFTDSSIKEQSYEEINKQCENKLTDEENDIILRSRTRKPPCLENFEDDERYDTCSRIKPYLGRKFSNGYYQNTNAKIRDMEQNDKGLQKRLMHLINGKSKNSLSPDEVKSESLFDTALINEPSSDSNISGGQESSKDERTFEQGFSIQQSIDESSESNLENISKKKSKLIAWFEKSYKHYKEKADKGIVTDCLQPPKFGNLVLYPWHFVLGRYKERKNHFLVSKLPPYRVFMAINLAHPLFRNCKNIDEIRFTNLHMYPRTIINLLTNATDLKDHYCILRGLSYCWELFATAAKLNDSPENDLIEKISNSNEPIQNTCFDKVSALLDSPLQLMEENEIEPCAFSVDSKWFLMTLENDFNEIQFHKKGFFVKYESIINAIRIARVSGNTVRLSSQKKVHETNQPLFGIYAIPDVNEYRVIIGPYDTNEPLGLETISNFAYVLRKKKTRGVWITTKKSDNAKIINDPFSFMPSDLQYKKMLSLSNACAKDKNQKIIISEACDQILKKTEDCSKINTENSKVIKTVKPITIRKTNGFYQLAPRSLFKPISVLKPTGKEAPTLLPEVLELMPVANSVTTHAKKYVSESHKSATLYANVSDLNKPRSLLVNVESKATSKPVAEVAPQVKILEKTTDINPTQSRKCKSGMFVLRPDEINKRAVKNNSASEIQVKPPDTNNTVIPPKTISENQNNVVMSANASAIRVIDIEVEDDIEHFLATSVKRTAPNTVIYEISDDEEGEHQNIESNLTAHQIKNVWIQCSNIKNLGYIKGKRDKMNRLSFEFPGFKYSGFHTEEVALSKINQVMSRKVFIPNEFNLQWEVIENQNELTSLTEMNSKSFTPDSILTPNGIVRQTQLLREGTSNNPTFSTQTVNNENDSSFHEQSDLLENMGTLLWHDTVKNKIGICHSLRTVPSHMREQLTEELQALHSENLSSQ